MDLSKLRHNDTYDHHLTLPSGEVLDIVITLAGPAHPARTAFDSKSYRQVSREYNRKGKAQIPEDADDVLEKQVDRMVAYTLGWQNLEIDGELVPFDKKTAHAIYGDPAYTWILADVSRAANEPENFTPSSSAS